MAFAPEVVVPALIAMRETYGDHVFGLYGFAKADAQTTLPTDKVPANIKNIELLREAYHSL